MNPHRLDLTTWRWVKEPGLVPNPGSGDALALPTPRQRAAAETVGDKWLLLLGGSPTQVWHIGGSNQKRLCICACLSVCLFVPAVCTPLAGIGGV